MAFDDDLLYERELGLLICIPHGQGLQPGLRAITRHFRGEGHGWRGLELKAAMARVVALRLSSIETLVQARAGSSAREVRHPIPHLKLTPGFSCMACRGAYLTSSLEMVQRHAQKEHGRPRQGPIMWERCHLQTIFSETKYRAYFRVLPQDARESAVMSMGQSTHSLIPSLVAPPTVFHPFAILAAPHVPLSIIKLDSLFKSGTFSSVAEPLFESSHVDAATNMTSVFPQCEDDALFMTAVVASLTRFVGANSQCSLQLEGRAIELLNDRIAKGTSSITSSTIGAIMVAKCTAYKLNDREVHAIHAKGLQSVMEACNLDIMGPCARRAFYCQDIFAAILLGEQRYASTDFLPNYHEVKKAQRELPRGFCMHRLMLPIELQDCIAENSALATQSLSLRNASKNVRYQFLDQAQAVAQARLVDVAQVCQDAGNLAESVRLAMFVYTYLCYHTGYRDNLVRCNIATRILEILEIELQQEESAGSWISENLNLLFWLILTVEAIDSRPPSTALRLTEKKTAVVLRVKNLLHSISMEMVLQAMQSAVYEFSSECGPVKEGGCDLLVILREMASSVLAQLDIQIA